MPKFVSEVLEPQQREKRKARGFARAAAAYVLISAAALGGVIYATNLEDKGAHTPSPEVYSLPETLSLTSKSCGSLQMTPARGTNYQQAW